jgi:hypothetical protein
MNIFQKPIGSLIYMPNHTGKKNLEPNSWLKLVFGIMTPPKDGVFTNIGKNFAEMLQIEDFAVNNVFLFYYVHIFVKKNYEFVLKPFYEWEKKI